MKISLASRANTRGLEDEDDCFMVSRSNRVGRSSMMHEIYHLHGTMKVVLGGIFLILVVLILKW